MVDELQVDGDHGVDVSGVDLSAEALRNVQPGLSPHNIEVGTELNTVLLKIHVECCEDEE